MTPAESSCFPPRRRTAQLATGLRHSGPQGMNQTPSSQCVTPQPPSISLAVVMSMVRAPACHCAGASSPQRCRATRSAPTADWPDVASESSTRLAGRAAISRGDLLPRGSPRRLGLPGRSRARCPCVRSARVRRQPRRAPPRCRRRAPTADCVRSRQQALSHPNAAMTALNLAIPDADDRTIHGVVRTPATAGSARPVSRGRVDESFSVTQANVDGEVDEDLRHLGAVSKLNGRSGAGRVKHARVVGLHDAS